MEKEKQESFKAMNIADLQNKGGPRARILPPEMLSEIIEQHTRTTMPQAASPEPLLEAAPAPELRFKFIREQTELYGDKFREALDV
jgi:hypothetical protein